ncbi:MAG: hypothetical protein R3E73_14675 [Porticoccaceae bacterium]
MSTVLKVWELVVLVWQQVVVVVLNLDKGIKTVKPGAKIHSGKVTLNKVDLSLRNPARAHRWSGCG